LSNVNTTFFLPLQAVRLAIAAFVAAGTTTFFGMQAFAAPGTPTNLRVVTHITSNGYHVVRWNASLGTSRYQVMRRIDGGPLESVHWSSSFQYSKFNPDDGAYEYMVRACSGGPTIWDCSPYSAPVSLVVLKRPSVPQMVTQDGVGMTDQQTLIEWTASTGTVDDYVLWRRDLHSNDGWRDITLVDGTRTERFLPNHPMGLWEFRVEATNGRWDKVFSPTVRVGVFVSRADELYSVRIRKRHREQSAYLQDMVDLISSVRPQPMDQVLGLLSEAVLFANEHSSDGLGPYILFLADMIATDGSSVQKAQARQVIGWWEPTYEWPVALSLVQPLARINSRIVAYLRPDIVRILSQQASSTETIGLEEIVNTPAVRNQICQLIGLNEVPNQTIPDELQEADQRRQILCDAGGGQGGRDFAVIAISGCIDNKPDTLTDVLGRHQGYGLYDAEADLHACMEHLNDLHNPGNGQVGPNIGFGWQAGLALLQRVSVEASLELQGDVSAPFVEMVKGFWSAVEKVIEEGNKTHRAELQQKFEQMQAEARRQQEKRDQFVALVVAVAEAQAALEDLADKQRDFDQALADWIQAKKDSDDAWVEWNKSTQEGSGKSPQEQETLRQRWETLKKREEQARKDKKEAKEKRDAAAEEVRKKQIEKIKAVVVASTGQDRDWDEGDPLSTSSACSRLTGGGQQYVELDSLWGGANFPTDGPWLEPVMTPNPDEPIPPSNGWALGTCGADKLAKFGCGDIAACIDDEPCGCHLDETEIEKNAKKTAETAELAQCAHIICEGHEVIPTGKMCVCTPDNEEPPDLPPSPLEHAFFGELEDFAGTPAYNAMDALDQLFLHTAQRAERPIER